MLKCGISFVSIEGARANLEHDIRDWNFDSVHKKGLALWQKALGGIAIEGGTDAQHEAFATALYHSMIDPRAFSDVNGLYPGADERPIKQAVLPIALFLAVGMFFAVNIRY